MTRRFNRLSQSLLLAALLGAGAGARADAQGLSADRDNLNNSRGDIWAVVTSPVHTRGRDVLTVAATLGAAAITSRIDSVGYLWLKSHDKTFVMQLLRPIREGTSHKLYEFGSGQYLLPMAGSLYLAGRLSHSRDLVDAGLGCASGHLASLALRQVTFRSVKRGRPAVSASPFNISVPGTSVWSWESFYSGHLSNSMACASLISNRFALGKLEALPFAFSAAIGLGRLADGHHWASDMVVGGVVGYAVGKAIADRQLARVERPAATGAALSSQARWSVPVFQWSVAF
jgi:membrane-associated phospholipid phosphatase